MADAIKKTPDLKVCDPNDPTIKALAGMDGTTVPWTMHGRGNACKKVQWLFGQYVGPNGEDLGFQHGKHVVEWLRNIKNGLDGKFVSGDQKLICMECHPPISGDSVFVPASANNTSPPACNTCHPIHSFFSGPLSSLSLTAVSMTPDGHKMGNPAEMSPVPPMNRQLGCPQCHESPRPPVSTENPKGSYAKKVTEGTRHDTQPCQTCHPKPAPDDSATKGDKQAK